VSIQCRSSRLDHRSIETFAKDDSLNSLKGAPALYPRVHLAVESDCPVHRQSNRYGAASLQCGSSDEPSDLSRRSALSLPSSIPKSTSSATREKA